MVLRALALPFRRLRCGVPTATCTCTHCTAEEGQPPLGTHLCSSVAAAAAAAPAAAAEAGHSPYSSSRRLRQQGGGA